MWYFICARHCAKPLKYISSFDCDETNKVGIIIILILWVTVTRGLQNNMGNLICTIEKFIHGNIKILYGGKDPQSTPGVQESIWKKDFTFVAHIILCLYFL